MPAFDPGSEAVCPECGACVPLVGERWLHVHRAGSAEYAYPRGNSRRCPGSLMLVVSDRRRDRSGENVLGYLEHHTGGQQPQGDSPRRARRETL